MVIVYNPENERIIEKRITEAEEILNNLPYKYCFISGSFLYKEKYKDIDVFIITRSRKKVKVNKKINITKIDFNDLHSLFYHSISKSCIAKNILPKKDLKVTIADYWGIVNEAVPGILNEKRKFQKEIRFLLLYTEYFKNKDILSTFELTRRINSFKNYKEVMDYIKKEVPELVIKPVHKSYIKRFFYTQAGFYKDITGKYSSGRFLYDLCHNIIKGAVHG